MVTATKKKTTTYHEPQRMSRGFDPTKLDGKEYWVPIEWVYPKMGTDEFSNSRTNFEQSNINRLIQGIRRDGQKTAIEVMYRPMTREDYDLPGYQEQPVKLDESPIAGEPLLHRGDVILPPDQWGDTPPHLMIKTGETRHRAAFARMLAGESKFIRVIVRPLISGIELDADVLAENDQRKQIAITDLAKIYRKWYAAGKSIDEIAVLGNVPNSKKKFIRWRLILTNLEPSLFKILEENEGNVTVNTKKGVKEIDLLSEGRARILGTLAGYEDASDDIGYPTESRHKMQLAVFEDMKQYAFEKGKAPGEQWLKDTVSEILNPQISAQKQKTKMTMPDNKAIEEEVAAITKRIMNVALSVSKLATQERGDDGHTPMVPMINTNQAKTLLALMEQAEKDAGFLKKTLQAHVARSRAAEIQEEVYDDELEGKSPEQLLAEITKG